MKEKPQNVRKWPQSEVFSVNPVEFLKQKEGVEYPVQEKAT